ncbi:MAG TPA: tetratricopeptide repeat protein [Bryobacteraceae bacterium]
MEVRTPQFEIATDAGESAARQLVIEMQQFDGAIAHAPGPLASFWKAPAPIRVYLFRTESEFAEYRAEPWISGLTLTSTHASPLILLYAGSKTRQTILHEYVHVLVKRGDWKLPRWFEEGLAEFYANSGRAVPEHVAQLRGRPATVGLFWSEPHDELAAHRFYAASWALVSMLMSDPAYRPRIHEFISAGPGDPMFAEAVRKLPAYLANAKWKPVEAPAISGDPAPIQTLDSNKVEFMLAALLLDAGRLEAAQKHYQKIAREHPQDALGAEASGLAALAGSQPELARTQFRRAIQQGSTNARVWSELAALDAAAGSPWKDVRPLLARAAKLDPDDPEAPYRLGVHETDEGQLAAAVAHLAGAVRAAPGKFDIWYAYAFALNRAGRIAEARDAGTRALRVAPTPEWERAAQQFLHGLDEPQVAAARRRAPEVVTPPSWESPRADGEVSGKFIEFVCAGDHPLFRVETSDKKMVELKVTNPKQVNILNTTPDRPAIDLRCGPQDGRPIRLEIRRSDSTVLGVEFPQVHDLPRF